MLLNRFEFALMNNPVRAAVQRRFEAARLLEMGGGLEGGKALELGCGRGIGVEIALDVFGADRVDAFDLDPAMIDRARTRLARRADRVRLWVGDATAIAAAGATYDAAFDFGIIHHVPRWRSALAEVARVLKPGGRFYAEEVLAGGLDLPLVRRLFRHPQEDRFDQSAFRAALGDAGLEPLSSRELGGIMAWFVAVRKPGA